MSQYNVDDTLIKKPGQDRDLTPEEADEWVKCAVDPIYFMTTYCKVVGGKGKMIFEPRSYQKEMIGGVIENQFTCINAPRQCGKTTSLALYALHQTVFTDDFTVGFTSFTTANCKDMLTRFKTAYEELPNFLKPCVTLYNRTEVRFSNGSQIYVQVTSENALRGRSNHLCLVDEFAFVSPAVADEFYTALLPSLTAEGENSTTKVVFVSTPNGTVGKYAEIAFGAMAHSNGYFYIPVDWKKIPGRTQKFKESMLKKMSKERYAQEYEGAFLSDSGTLINSTILESLQTREAVSTFREFTEIFVHSLQGRNIAFACDVSEGISKDNHCIQAIDIETFEQVAEFTNNTLNQTLYFKEILHLIRFLKAQGVNDLYYTVEANGLGHGIMRLIETTNDPYINEAVLISDLKPNGSLARMGMLTTNSSKMKGCTLLKDLIESGRLKINSVKLLTELKFFVKHGASFAADKGAKDDRVMGMVLLANMLPHISNYDDTVHDMINDTSLDDEDWGISF